MRTFSIFHKERALREAGWDVPPYPKGATNPDLPAQEQLLADRHFLDACDAWDDAVETQYRKLLLELPPFQPTADVVEFVERCNSYGLTAGLTGLNSRVPHRYTALYRLDHATLRNIELVDKANETKPEFLAAVPLSHSFCQFVLRDGSFLTSNSAQEDRLDGHPYKGVMVSYHGVPVLDDKGELFGSLCHFDVAERSLPDSEFEHLQGVARSIAPYLGAAG